MGDGFVLIGIDRSHCNHAFGLRGYGLERGSEGVAVGTPGRVEEEEEGAVGVGGEEEGVEGSGGGEIGDGAACVGVLFWIFMG